MKKNTKNDNINAQIEVILFTDGACRGNPGPGGWAFILRHPKSGKQIARNGGEAETTNNRMELMAVIAGLRALNRATSVEIVSDSTYVLQGMSSWMKNWKVNGWKRREGGKFKEVKNVDLWQELDRLITVHELTFTHVRGHQGHPENEECDRLAVEASQKFSKKS